MELTRLKVNSQYRPCVDEVPYFSWVIISDKKNVMQTSYHITVTSLGEVVWDSGHRWRGFHPEKDEYEETRRKR